MSSVPHTFRWCCSFQQGEMFTLHITAGGTHNVQFLLTSTQKTGALRSELCWTHGFQQLLLKSLGLSLYTCVLWTESSFPACATLCSCFSVVARVSSIGHGVRHYCALFPGALSKFQLRVTLGFLFSSSLRQWIAARAFHKWFMGISPPVHICQELSGALFAFVPGWRVFFFHSSKVVS